MSVNVVHLLEVVQVEERETETRPRPPAACGLAGDRLLAGVPVVESRQRIGERKMLQCRPALFGTRCALQYLGSGIHRISSPELVGHGASEIGQPVNLFRTEL